MWSAQSGPLTEEGNEWWSEDGDVLTIGWSGYAEYVVRLHPSPSVAATLGTIPESEAGLAFLLSVLPLALPLFEVEPLPAVRTNRAAVLFLGPKGSGKSSIASAMENNGFGLLADDCSAIDEHMRLWPGPPLLNPRWNDAQQPVVGTYNTKSVRAPSRYSPDPHEIASVVSLAPDAGAPLELQPLRANDAFVQILANVRSPGVFASRRRARQLRIAEALSTLPCSTLTYDPTVHPFEDVAATVARRSG
jgi:hypothetical protein